MASLKTEIYNILAADAQINNEGNLGSMLGLSAAAPYGVYFRNPPTSHDFKTYSVITYFVVSMSGRFPRDIYIAITAWGRNFEDILNRCYELLHEKKLETTDYSVLMLKWDNAGPELFADDHRTYFQQHRYLVRAIKK